MYLYRYIFSSAGGGDVFLSCAFMGMVVYSVLCVVSSPLGSSEDGLLFMPKLLEVSHGPPFPEACWEGGARKMREEVETGLRARD